VRLHRLSERIGVLVRRLDLGAPLSEADQTTLRQAVRAHGLLALEAGRDR
jgi:alpha-ketoglutarate-dependent taurine dioxygenase